MSTPSAIRLHIALVAALFAAAGVAGAAAGPMVLAVDSSRSLTGADLATLRTVVEPALRGTTAPLRIGLVTFDDQARWLVAADGSLDAVLTSLAAVEPAGNHTVLHDALFAAARGLDAGGVIILASDGRDENSATTLDDVARLCAARGIRIIAVGVGRQVDERSLRRLALLTEGAHLGHVDAVDPVALADAVTAALTAPAEAPTTAPTPAAEPRPTPPAIEAPRPGSPRRQWAWITSSPITLAAIAAALIALAALLWMVLRRPSHRQCSVCGGTLESWESSCARCKIREMEAAAQTREVVLPAVEEIKLDPSVYERAPLPEGLERTAVLDERPTLVARLSGKPAQAHTLPRDAIFTVGRAPGVNILQVPDPAVSAQHFKIVPKDGEFYVIDLDTTNGTTVNGERVRVRKLSPGDVIRVGTSQFEFKMAIRHLS